MGKLYSYVFTIQNEWGGASQHAEAAQPSGSAQQPQPQSQLGEEPLPPQAYTEDSSLLGASQQQSTSAQGSLDAILPFQSHEDAERHKRQGSFSSSQSNPLLPPPCTPPHPAAKRKQPSVSDDLPQNSPRYWPPPPMPDARRGRLSRVSAGDQQPAASTPPPYHHQQQQILQPPRQGALLQQPQQVPADFSLYGGPPSWGGQQPVSVLAAPEWAPVRPTLPPPPSTAYMASAPPQPPPQASQQAWQSQQQFGHHQPPGPGSAVDLRWHSQPPQSIVYDMPHVLPSQFIPPAGLPHVPHGQVQAIKRGPVPASGLSAHSNNRLSGHRRQKSSSTSPIHGRLSKHRKTLSRTRQQTLEPYKPLESSSYEGDLCVPTFIPDVSGQQDEPPVLAAPLGGYYWCLKTDSEGDFDSGSEVPIQLYEPPLRHCIPTNPEGLQDDNQPRSRKKSKYTPSQDQMILRLKKEGKSWSEIARLAHCGDTLAARNRYQVLIGQQGGGTFLWTRDDCIKFQNLLDEGERAKWHYIATELTKSFGRPVAMTACYWKVRELFFQKPENFGVIKTHDPQRGGAPIRRRPLN